MNLHYGEPAIARQCTKGHEWTDTSIWSPSTFTFRMPDCQKSFCLRCMMEWMEANIGQVVEKPEPTIVVKQ